MMVFGREKKVWLCIKCAPTIELVRDKFAGYGCLRKIRSCEKQLTFCPCWVIIRLLENKQSLERLQLEIEDMTNALHTFEISGLGQAPFKVTVPSKTYLTTCSIFFCDHCGRQLKNRHFVADVNGRISVVGSSCILQSGDAGLAAGFKRLQREQRHAARELQRQAALASAETIQRQALDGYTLAELQNSLQTKWEQAKKDLCLELEGSLLVDALQQGMHKGNSFCASMFWQAQDAKPYTAAQRAAVLEIMTKFAANGARKNSLAYRENLQLASDTLARASNTINKFADVLSALEADLNAARHKVV